MYVCMYIGIRWRSNLINEQLIDFQVQLTYSDYDLTTHSETRKLISSIVPHNLNYDSSYYKNILPLKASIKIQKIQMQMQMPTGLCLN